MSINLNRPVITYENIALFQSDTPAHDSLSNSGENLSFIPLVQSINFSTDLDRSDAGALGTKDFVDQSNRSAPDVQFSINTIETFGSLFSGLLTGYNVRENLNVDSNFYAVIGDEKGVDVSSQSLSGKDLLSFGNCFLNGISVSQSVGGLINSEYSYVGSNIQAQQLEQNGNLFSGDCPSINLTGDQTQEKKVLFNEISSYYSDSAKNVIPSYLTNVTISGSGSVGNFLINSDSIQSFDLNLQVNRKTIYSVGKKFPLFRKAIFPSKGSFNFSNLVSNFEVNGERANLKDFLNSDENYTLNISGKDIDYNSFDFQINDMKLGSQSYDSSIGSSSSVNLGFFFEINKVSLLKTQRNFSYLFTEDGSRMLTQQSNFIIQ